MACRELVLSGMLFALPWALESRVQGDQETPVASAGQPGDWELFSKADTAMASVEIAFGGPDGKPCAKMEFAFTGGKHQWAIMAMELPEGITPEHKAIRLTYQATFPSEIPGPLVVLVEQDGAQYSLEPGPPPSAEWDTLRLPLELFRLAKWSKDANGQLDLRHVTRINIAANGKPRGDLGVGVLRVSDLALVSDIPADENELPFRWKIVRDSVTEARVALPREGAEGRRVMRLDFAFPPDQASWAYALTPIVGQDLADRKCRSLRITYQAKLPDGIGTLKVHLAERDGGDYKAALDPTDGEGWQTVEVRFESLEQEWDSTDENDRFDLARVNRLGIGTGGKIVGEHRAGTILVSGVEFLE